MTLGLVNTARSTHRCAQILTVSSSVEAVTECNILHTDGLTIHCATGVKKTQVAGQQTLDKGKWRRDRSKSRLHSR
jgi:hypothetical protein